MTYFSDREHGPRERTVDEIPPHVWGGLTQVIRRRINDASLAEAFPSGCEDGEGVSGTNAYEFWIGAQAEIPDLPDSLDPNSQPSLAQAMDLLEFVFRHVTKAVGQNYHSFWRHYHYSFSGDHSEARDQFLGDVNRLFSRNGIAFEMRDAGEIHRVVSRELAGLLESRLITGDATLDSLLTEARKYILRPELADRRLGLEKLWDAWERLKSLDDPSNKKNSVTILLNRTTTIPEFRAVLEDESVNLTSVGNTFRIRHSEVQQVQLDDPSYVDYLFHRMLALQVLLLRQMGRLR